MQRSSTRRAKTTSFQRCRSSSPSAAISENAWLGASLAIGNDVLIGVAWPDHRGGMPRLAQEDRPKDLRTLNALAQQISIGDAGTRYRCAGVHAVAEETGVVRRD